MLSRIVGEAHLSDLLDPLQELVAQIARRVHLLNQLQSLVQALAGLRHLALEPLQGLVSRDVVGKRVVQKRVPGSGTDQAGAQQDLLQLLGIEAVRLGQHALRHSDLPEVVQQRGVGELCELGFSELVAGERSRARAAHRSRQGNGEGGDAARVTARRRVASLDSGDAGIHEALEHALDVRLELGPLERERGAARDRDGVVQVPLAEREARGAIVDLDHTDVFARAA